MGAPGGRGVSGWTFTNHACRECLGTVMRSGDSFICAICRATAEGSPAGICGCGAMVMGLTGPRLAGLRCVPNPAPGPHCPSHVLIALAAV